MKSLMQTSNESPSNEQNSAPEFHPMDSASLSVLSNGRKITHEDIEVVQNLIERCLQLYMNRNEVVNILLNQARIEPDFTTLVWQKLEEENAEFFKAYYVRLVLKKQIVLFNQLLERQYRLMNSSAPSKVPIVPAQNGIQHMLVNMQPSIPSIDNPQSDSVGSVCSCNVVDGIPASGNFHLMQINSGLERPLDPVSDVAAIKSEMAISPTSVTSDGQFSFIPTMMSDSGVDALAFDSAYASHMTTPDGMLLGSEYGAESFKESLKPFCQMPWNISFSDLAADLVNVEDHGQMGHYLSSGASLGSPEQDNIVEEFFVDPVPDPGAQTEELS